MPLTVKWDGGISVQCGDFHAIFDPQGRGGGCSRAFVTHAHLDHAGAFGMPYLAKYSSGETRDLAGIYGGGASNWEPVHLGGRVTVDGVQVVAHNSGHVLGAYMYEVVAPEGSVVYTGDLNFLDTKTMEAAEVVPCDILVLEATFGSPGFVFPPEDRVAAEMVRWAVNSLRRGKIPAFQTDPLGNAQEVIHIFNELTRIPVTTHRQVTMISKVYEAYGHRLEYLDASSEEATGVTSSGECIFVSPKGLNLSRYPDFDPALVSGWAVWAGGGAFALSDHADFPHILQFVEACSPKTVLTCHGGRFEKTLARHIENELGIDARPLDLLPTTLVDRRSG